MRFAKPMFATVARTARKRRTERANNQCGTARIAPKSVSAETNTEPPTDTSEVLQRNVHKVERLILVLVVRRPGEAYRDRHQLALLEAAGNT